MNNVKVIRQAVITDIDPLSYLMDQYRQFYGKSSNVKAAQAFLLERFNYNESMIFVAEDATNQTLLGFTQLYPLFSSIALARAFLLNDLFVLPEYRQQNVAARLIDAAVIYARQCGAVRLSLSTAMTNVTAQRVYKSTGWVQDNDFLYFHYSLSR